MCAFNLAPGQPAVCDSLKINMYNFCNYGTIDYEFN